MKLDIFQICLVATVVVSIIAPLIRKKRQLSPADIDEIVGKGCVLVAGIATLQLLFRVLTNDTLKETLLKALDSDGVIALFVGSGYGIYLAYKSLTKLMSQ
jgi:hypothetical protein